MTTDNPYGIDPATLPSKLLADIAVAVDYLAMRPDANDKARLERLRQLITPPPPPECGWYPESVLKALEALRAALEIFEEPYDIEVAIDDLTNARCTLPAGHHEYVVPFRDIYTPGCSHSADDPIHCGHEHRIDKWVKP
jgi:hypothetical protein